MKIINDLFKLICFSVVIFVITNSAIAQNQSDTSNTNENSESNPMTAPVTGNLTSFGADHVNDKADKTMQLSTLSLFASSFLAPTYLWTCANMPSSWIFAGTAGVYVVSEIQNYKKYQNATETIKLNIDKNSDEFHKDIQLASIENAETQTRAAAEAMEQKAKNAKIAALGFTAASAMALVEQFSPWFGTGVCTGANEVSPKFDYKPQTKFAFNDKNYDEAIALANFANNMKFAQGKISSIRLEEYYGLSKHNDLLAQFGFKNNILKLYNSMLNNAYASGAADSKKLQNVGIIAGAGGAIGTLWGTVVVQRMRDMVSAKWSGAVRSAVFAANAAMAGVGRFQDKCRLC